MRFGVDVARYRVNEWHPELGGGPKGTFTFNGSVTLPGTGSPNQFNNYAAFLLGLPQQISKSIAPDWRSPRQWMEGTYFRDRWQVNHNLTLTLGMRWEYYPIMTYAHFGMVRFDASTDTIFVGGLGSVPNDAGISTSKKQFAPRVGLAYRLGSKSVIRGGYGISVDPQGPLAQMLFSYPLEVLQTFAGNTASIPYGPIANGIPAIPYPNLSSGTVPLPLPISTVTLPAGPYKRGYTQSYNFTAQRELPGGFVALGRLRGYAHGAREPAFQHQCGQSGRRQQRAARWPSSPAARSMRPSSAPLGFSTYNALQAQVDRKISRGLLVKVSYTYSKAIDNVDNELGTLMFYDAANFARNRALASFDRTHNFRVAWVADLPFGAGKRWVQNGIGTQGAGWMAGEWNLQRLQRHSFQRDRIAVLP